MGTYIKAIRRFEKKRPRKRGLTITVSGLAYSGKTSVAEYLAKKLNLKVFEAGGAFWRSIAKERGVDLDKLSRTAEKKIDIEMDKRTLRLAQKGGVILIGRLAAWAAGDWADYKIMVTASKEEQVKRAWKRDRIPAEKAIKLIKGRDKQDRQRYLKYYGIDLSDYSVYNLVFDTTNFSVDQTAEIVLKIVRTALSL